MSTHRFTPRQADEFARALGVNGRLYTCPHCAQAFKAEPKLWLHARQQHASVLGVLATQEEETKARSLLKRDAMPNASSTSRSTNQVVNQGETSTAKASPDSGRPTTRSGRGGESPKRLLDYANRGQVSSRIPGMLSVPPNATTPVKISPKPFQLDSSSSNISATTKTHHTNGQARHQKNRSNDQVDMHRVPHQSRQHRMPSPLGRQRRLYDPRDDDAGRGPVTWNASGTDSKIPASHAPDTTVQPARAGSTMPQSSQMPPKTVPSSKRHPTPGILYTDIARLKASSVQVNESKASRQALEDMSSSVVGEDRDEPEPDIRMLRQPNTRPISHEQLMLEVNGIYAGLVMIEAKCVDVAEKHKAMVVAFQTSNSISVSYTTDQWRSLIALHKQLLHEHHDFFMASQHPVASPDLRQLAVKYSMPTRVWRHGVHTFLEILRSCLPESLEHMLAFIYMAYSMMALLYETVPAFEDTWIEGLGDLGRYRMAMENNDPRDKEIWAQVAKYWYRKASEKSPDKGRLYHHLAVLARPSSVEQLSLYTRSLTCTIPYESARSPVLGVFNSVLSVPMESSDFETKLVKAHASLFTSSHSSLEIVDRLLAVFQKTGVADLLNSPEGQVETFRKVGTYSAIANVAAMFGYGIGDGKPQSRSRLQSAFDSSRGDPGSSGQHGLISPESGPEKRIMMYDDVGLNSNSSDMDIDSLTLLVPLPSTSFPRACLMSFSFLANAMHQDPWQSPTFEDFAPSVHINMVFIWASAAAGLPIQHTESFVPWASICLYMNNLLEAPGLTVPHHSQIEFPTKNVMPDRPLWEDIMILRGQIFARDYFPEDYFTKGALDDEERRLELPSMDIARKERILWLAFRIAKMEKWIIYDITTSKFSPTTYASSLAAKTLADYPALAKYLEPPAINDKADVVISKPL